MPSKRLSAKAGKFFSYFMYWLENTLFLTIFIAFESVLTPFMYLKVFYNLIFIPYGLLFKVFLFIFWLF